MNRRARIFAQLGFVAYADAAAVARENEWPPVQPTEAEIEQSRHLNGIADAWFEHADALDFREGTDAAFGEES